MAWQGVIEARTIPTIGLRCETVNCPSQELPENPQRITAHRAQFIIPECFLWIESPAHKQPECPPTERAIMDGCLNLIAKKAGMHCAVL